MRNQNIRQSNAYPVIWNISPTHHNAAAFVQSTPKLLSTILQFQL